MPRKIKQRAAYGSGSVVQVRPGVWRVRVRAEGSQICRTVVGSEAQAVRMKKSLISQLTDGSYVAPAPTTFGEYLTEWLENVAKAKAPGTYMLYRRTADKWILPALAGVNLQKLKPSDLRAYFAELSELAPSTRQQHYLIIHGALKAAQSEGLVRDNAASKMAGKPKRGAEAPAENAMLNCWNEAEARKFLAVAQGYGPRQAAFYSLALDTGMRKGELCALKWADVDFIKGSVRVRTSLSYATGEAVIGPTKNRQARLLTISPETLAFLQRLSIAQADLKRARGAAWTETGLVFTGKFGRPIRSSNIGEHEFDKLIQLAQVKRIRFHGLRHTCATLLLTAGVPVNYVSERLGHQDPAITLRIYAHAIPSGQAMLMDKLRSALGFTGEAKVPAEGWRN